MRHLLSIVVSCCQSCYLFASFQDSDQACVTTQLHNQPFEIVSAITAPPSRYIHWIHRWMTQDPIAAIDRIHIDINILAYQLRQSGRRRETLRCRLVILRCLCDCYR